MNKTSNLIQETKTLGTPSKISKKSIKKRLIF